MQSNIRRTQPRRSTPYYNALVATRYYNPELNCPEAHQQRQRARSIVANDESLPLHIRQEAAKDPLGNPEVNPEVIPETTRTQEEEEEAEGTKHHPPDHSNPEEE